MSEPDDPQHANQTNRSAEYVQSDARGTATQRRQNSTENGTDPDWPYMFTTNIRLGMSLDDWDEYESGAIDATRSCDEQARILAFGAIRRAAKHARNCDLNAPQSNGFVWRGDTPQSAAIRCAIRLAIGSPKA